MYKRQRIRSLETKAEQRVEEDVDNEYIGIVNYGIIGLIQRNSRHFARKQLTWQRRHPEFAPLDLSSPWEPLLERIQQDLRCV